MKHFLVLGMALLTFSAYSSDKGNGGSGDESSIAARQAILEGTALKIKKFFSINGGRLQEEFPEFKTLDLVTVIDNSDIRIVDVKELKDKHGKNRTCLNYPQSKLIECSYSEIAKIESNPQALFVLIMHEYLGLLGVEETSPQDSRLIDGYSISKRIAGYVSKVNDYDLQLNKDQDKCVMSVPKYIHGEIAKILSDKNYKLTNAPIESLENGDYYFQNFDSGATDGSCFLVSSTTVRQNNSFSLYKKGAVDIKIGGYKNSFCRNNYNYNKDSEMMLKAAKKLPSCKD
jgi:hypothetical protein